jgi:hypothetical protein
VESIGAEWQPEDSGYRQRYAYTINPAHDPWIYEGNDIRSGCGAVVDVADILRTLASFLGAAAEAYRYEMRRGSTSENSDLFPAHVNEWAYHFEDELSMLAEDPADRMRELGAEAGRAAGSWVIDGNTSIETLRAVLSDDFEFDVPAPLSGEWSDGPLPRDVLAEVGVTEDDDEADDLLNEYEQAYSDAYIAETQRSASAMLPADDDSTDDSEGLRP